MTSILDLSITRSSISVGSEALAVPVNSGFHRENRTLTASNQTIIRGFESPSVVNYQLLQPRMVKRLTQMATSISRRGYYGISQTKGAYRGYLICSLRARRSIGRSQAFGDWGSTFESLRAHKMERYEKWYISSSPDEW